MFDKIINDKDLLWHFAEHDVLKYEVISNYSIEQATELFRANSKVKKNE